MAVISRRESAALINSLYAGVVPRVGLRHIAVGRQLEVNAFLQDLITVEEGGAAFRFVCGRFGSGKSFLLQLIRNNAMERSFVVLDADLSPERRLTGTKGQGLATYRELMQHLSTRARPDGGALEAILQKWIVSLQAAVAKEYHYQAGDPALIDAVSDRVTSILSELSEMAYGFAFSNVVDAYWRGTKTGNDLLKQNALRWLRGEFVTKTEAKKELPVDCIIDDQSWYDFLKLFALFVHKAGYKGLLVFMDECVNLYKINNKQARDSNYEKILTIFNDTMQGKARYIGVIMSGTKDFIYDERRGLFCYEALKSRLANGRFKFQKFTDYTNPVIELSQLSHDELYLYLERLCELHGAHYSYNCIPDSEKLTAFLNAELSQLGAEQMLTPREVTKDFLTLLNAVHQNPDADWMTLLDTQKINSSNKEKKPEFVDDSFDKLLEDFDI